MKALFQLGWTQRNSFSFFSVFAVVILSALRQDSAWAWGNNGHQIVAIIAADDLSPAARAHSRICLERLTM